MITLQEQHEMAIDQLSMAQEDFKKSPEAETYANLLECAEALIICHRNSQKVLDGSFNEKAPD